MGPDWECVCGQTVWPSKSACFKCGARRSAVTGRDSLGYTEAKKEHQDAVHEKWDKKMARAQKDLNSLIASTPKRMRKAEKELNSLIASSSNRSYRSKRFTPVEVPALITDESSSMSVRGLAGYRRPTNDRFPTSNPFRRRGRRQRPASDRFAAGVDKSATPATKVDGRIFSFRISRLKLEAFSVAEGLRPALGLT